MKRTSFRTKFQSDACRDSVDNISQLCNEMTVLKNIMNKMYNTFEERIAEMDEKLEAIHTTCSDVLLQTGILIKEYTANVNEETSKYYNSMSHQLNNLCKAINCLTNTVQSIIPFSVLPGNTDPDNSSAVVLMPKSNKLSMQIETSDSVNTDYQVVPLNSEQDYPDGSWLGDDTVPEARVRVPVTPGELLYINTQCLTPERMALTLLDYLFPRKILAISNLSGKGRHGKKQLNPLFVYGIHCHLVYKFGITDKKWCRIKQNMDSKCRTIWKRKLQGLPIGINRADENFEFFHESDQSELDLQSTRDGILLDGEHDFIGSTITIENNINDYEEDDNESVIERSVDSIPNSEYISNETCAIMEFFKPEYEEENTMETESIPDSLDSKIDGHACLDKDNSNCNAVILLTMENVKDQIK